MVAFGFLAQPVEHDTGLHARGLALRIEVDQFIEVLGEIENHCDVAALPGEACPASTRQQWRLMTPALLDSRDHVFHRFWYNDANRHLPVIGAVRCIERPAAVIEADFALDPFSNLRFESVCLA